MIKCTRTQSRKQSVEQLVEEYRHELELIRSHQYNWLHQAEKFSEIKESVADNEMVLHIGFTENYG